MEKPRRNWKLLFLWVLAVMVGVAVGLSLDWYKEGGDEGQAAIYSHIWTYLKMKNPILLQGKINCEDDEKNTTKKGLFLKENFNMSKVSTEILES